MLKLNTLQDDCRYARLDAGETIFFARSLEAVKATVRPIIYTELSAFRLFPLTSDGGPTAKTLVWTQIDSVGKARVIAGYADDLPKVGISAVENRTPIRSLGASYGWSLQDVRSAMAANMPLESRLAQAAMRAHNELMNEYAWNGSAEHGLPGLKTDTNITNVADATTGNWASATADQIIADITEMLNSITTQTNGVERPNTIVMPPAQLAIMSTKARSTTSDTTVLTFAQAAFPEITFESAVEMIDWTASKDAMMAYTRDAEHLSIEVPQPYEEMPVERHALRFEVATHTRFAGLCVYYPKAVAIRTNI